MNPIYLVKIQVLFRCFDVIDQRAELFVKWIILQGKLTSEINSHLFFQQKSVLAAREYVICQQKFLVYYADESSIKNVRNINPI